MTDKKTAVHLHSYYIDQLPYLIEKLHNLDKVKVAYDLYVTITEDNESIKEEILREFPRAIIWQVENRGYDVGPFIDFLHKIDFGKYEYILKIHTKNQKQGQYTHLNGRRFDNKLWGEVLYEALLGSELQIEKNFEIMQNDNVGMVSSGYCITAERKTYEQFLPQINQELHKLGFDRSIEKLSFVAGTMFWVKTKVLQKLTTYNITDFPITDGSQKEGTKAHMFERLFGALVQVNGMQLFGVKQYRYGRQFLWQEIKRFCFQKKVTKHGKLLIKILKIPVFCKKI